MGAGRPGSDGTFYLGIRPGDTELPKGYKNWKELGVGGKGQLEPLVSSSIFVLLLILCLFHARFLSGWPMTVARTGARATSTFVILAGAGLTALLVYALATELGSSVSDSSILDYPVQY
jgi:hypothetical protein